MVIDINSDGGQVGPVAWANSAWGMFGSVFFRLNDEWRPLVRLTNVGPRHGLLTDEPEAHLCH